MPRIEVLPTAKTAATPGWAYVPDTGFDPSKAAINPTGARKRGKQNLVNTSSNVSAINSRQQSTIARRLAELDREGGGKDISLPGGARPGGAGKTQATRKILTSQKTFANHIADEEAWITQGGQFAAATPTAASTDADGAKGRRKSAPFPGRGRGNGPKRMSLDANLTAIPAEIPVATASTPAVAGLAGGGDVVTSHEALLAVTTLTIPSPVELELLLSSAPLSFHAARAGPPGNTAPPPRQLCEICGYWGRVRCLKCGSRVCGLDCLTSHRLECSRRFA